jgi:4-carboxymuconolactone decarboxylase
MSQTVNRLALAVVLIVVFQAAHHGQRLSTPRIPPIDPDPKSWTPAQKQILGNAPASNAFRVCVKNEPVCVAWRGYLDSVGRTLTPRERELLILRVTALNGDEYLWGMHRGVELASLKLVSNDEARRVAQGAKAAGWSEHDAALVQAVDELVSDAFIKDGTWKTLSKRYREDQMLDLIFTVGAYHVSSWYMQNSGVRLPAGQERIPIPR